MNGELLGRTMTTHIIALGGSLLRPEEAEKKSTMVWPVTTDGSSARRK